MALEKIRQAKIRELEERWQRLSQLLEGLRKERDLETRADEKLRLDDRIAEVDSQRSEVEQKLRELTDGAPPAPSAAASTGAVELFYSYAHEDEPLRRELEKHLKLLERQGLLRGWHDRELVAGTDWDREIDERLRSADVILLLVSADFMASDYIWGKELRVAMARHEAGEARVIPVVLRPVDWSAAPFARLQALPKDARPVVSWASRDEAFADVARGIRRVVSELR